MRVEPVMPPLAEDMPVDVKNAVAARRQMLVTGTCPLCHAELDLDRVCAIPLMQRDGSVRVVAAVISQHDPDCPAGSELVQRLILAQEVKTL